MKAIKEYKYLIMFSVISLFVCAIPVVNSMSSLNKENVKLKLTVIAQKNAIDKTVKVYRDQIDLLIKNNAELWTYKDTYVALNASFTGEVDKNIKLRRSNAALTRSYRDLNTAFMAAKARIKELENHVVYFPPLGEIKLSDTMSMCTNHKHQRWRFDYADKVWESQHDEKLQQMRYKLARQSGVIDDSISEADTLKNKIDILEDELQKARDVIAMLKPLVDLVPKTRKGIIGAVAGFIGGGVIGWFGRGLVK